MKDMSQDICKSEAFSDQASLDLEVSSMRPRRWSSRLISFWVVLVICLLLLVAPVSAHEGLDPDIQEITEKLTKNPNDVKLLLLRAGNYRLNGEPIKSLADLDRANQLEPDNQEILLHRGLTLSALKRDVEAEVVLSRFLEEVAAQIPGDIADRILSTKSAKITGRTSDKNLLLTALVERAYVHLRRNKAQLALKDCTRAIKIRPSTPLYLFCGKLQESLGQFVQAAAGYREGLARVGRARPLKKSLIRVEIEQQRYRQALNLIDEELAQASVKTEWYLRRAVILDVMGNKKDSQKAKEKALTEANRVLGKRNTALKRLARAKVYMALGQRVEARRDLELAVQMAPKFDKARELLGILKGQGE